MKEIIYNLILAFIGLFVVYIIFYNYLGSNDVEEGFEVDDEGNTTPYDPADAAKSGDSTEKEQAATSTNTANAAAPTSTEMTQSAPSDYKDTGQAQTETVSAEPGESFSNDDSDSDDEEEPTSFFGKISKFIFGNVEAFRTWNHPGKYPGSAGRRPRRYNPRRRRDRHRRHRWHRWHRWAHHDRAYRRNYAAWARRWRAWRSWRWRRWRWWRQQYWRRRRAAVAARRAKRTAAAKPYVNMWNKSGAEINQIKSKQTQANSTITDRNERNRLGRDVSRKYRLRYGNRHPWHHWRHQGWINSAKYWHARRKPSAGRHWRWQGEGGGANAIKLIDDRVNEKKRRDAEAKKAGARVAHWSTLAKKGNEKLGQFNQDQKGKMSGSFYSNLINTYGLNKPIKDWKNENVDEAHKLIDDKYDAIQEARAAALRAKAAFALGQMQAAQEAAQQAQAASAAMAKADKEAQLAASKAAAKQAAETAAAVANMTGTLNKANINVAQNKSLLDGDYAAFVDLNENTKKSAQANVSTINDLLTLQAGRDAKVNNVPMASIKKISLQARRNYDASIKK